MYEAASSVSLVPFRDVLRCGVFMSWVIVGGIANSALEGKDLVGRVVDVDGSAASGIDGVKDGISGETPITSGDFPAGALVKSPSGEPRNGEFRKYIGPGCL